MEQKNQDYLDKELKEFNIKLNEKLNVIFSDSLLQELSIKIGEYVELYTNQYIHEIEDIEERKKKINGVIPYSLEREEISVKNKLTLNLTGILKISHSTHTQNL